jgi:hypothetical protein
MQCSWCNRIECPDGKPAPELAAYAVADQADDSVTHPLEAPGKEVG